jgi:hypothetical protein
MHQDIIRTTRPDDTVCLKTANPFSAFIPVSYPAVAVDEIYTVVKVVQNLFVKALVSIHEFPLGLVMKKVKDTNYSLSLLDNTKYRIGLKR